MISIAVNIIFFWVLGLTMQAQTVKEAPPQKIESKQEIKKPETPAVIPEKPAPAPNDLKPAS